MVTRTREAGTTNNRKAAILADIEAVASNWSVVHGKLSILSRSLLEYIPDTGDIGTLNRLLDAMAGARGRRNHQRDIIVMYFLNFLEWKYDEKSGKFGGKITGAGLIARRVNNRIAWLKNTSNDIWKWADENVKRPERTIDYIGGIGNAVNRALDAEKNAAYFAKHSKADAIAAIMRQVFASIGMDEAKKAADELYAKRGELIAAGEAKSTANAETTAETNPAEPVKSDAPIKKQRTAKTEETVKA